MIHCKDITRIPNLSFDSYKLLPQYNYSFLKNEKSGYTSQITATPKMILGILVDGILCDGEVDIANKLYPAAKHIAGVLKSEFGWLLDSVEKQMSYTGTMILRKNGIEFGLPIKGRPDFELKKNSSLI